MPKVLVTCGGSREPIDPVRYIGNRSSGTLGLMIAQSAFLHDWDVFLLKAEGTAALPPGFNKIHCQEFSDSISLQSSMKQVFEDWHPDIVIHAAAVADYRLKNPLEHKLASGREELLLELEPTPKLARMVKSHMPHSYLVLFKLETKPEKLVPAAKKCLFENSGDLILANTHDSIGSNSSHRVLVIDRKGDVIATWTGKKEIASNLVAYIQETIQ